MRRPIVAMGACLGAYLLQPWASVLAPTAAVIANAICFAVLFLCVRSLVARSLRQVQRSEPQAEMAVAHPQSFLPTGHLLFVTIFGLTPRESEVFALLAQGRTVGVIRERLVTSLNTARFHTKNIYAKLGCIPSRGSSTWRRISNRPRKRCSGPEAQQGVVVARARRALRENPCKAQETPLPK